MIKINVSKKLLMAGVETRLKVEAELQRGSFTALHGPSGAGKTTLLRILAGLVQPEQGIIEVNGQTWLHTAKKINLPPQQRNIGFVFQDYALFPNMTVEQNLRYALPMGDDSSRIVQMLTLTGLQNLAARKPDTLSGGQKQRVALARALMRKPQLLLLDEPLAALDNEARLQLQAELQDIHQQTQVTTVLVSHQVAEIYKLADRVICIDKGNVKQSGSPAQVFGIHHQETGLHLTGEVIRITAIGVEVLVADQLLSIPANSPGTANLKAGDKVRIQAADLTLQKLL